jgi:hypothetical protein
MRQFPTARLPYPHAGDSKMARLCGRVEFLQRAYFVSKRMRKALNPFTSLKPWATPGGT